MSAPFRGRLAGRTTIAAPLLQVWDYVTDWERQGEWIPFTRVRVVGDDPPAMVARTGIGPLGFDDTMHVTVWEPPRRCDVAHTGRVVRGTGIFVCEPAWHGLTAFSWTEDVEVPGGRLAPVLWAVARPVLTVAYGVTLRRLRRRLERQS